MPHFVDEQRKIRCKARVVDAEGYRQDILLAPRSIFHGCFIPQISYNSGNIVLASASGAKIYKMPMVSSLCYIEEGLIY